MRRAPALLIVAALAFYLWSLAPGLLWGDSAKFQRMAWEGEIRFDATGHPLWVALVHPLTMLPGLDPARAANLSSALLSALALWPAFGIARRLGAGVAASILACVSLALSHTWWMHAVVAEVYALNSLLSLAVLAALLHTAGRNPSRAVTAACVCLGLLYGVGCGNHLLLTLWLAGLIWLAPSRHAFAAGAVAGLAPFLLLRLTIEKGESLGKIAVRVGGSALSPAEVLSHLLTTIGYLLYQFPTLLPVAAAAAGAVSLWRRRRRTAIGLLALAVPSAAFGTIYPVRDRFAFLLPFWILVALSAACGLDRLLDRCRTSRARLAALATGALLAAAPPPIYLAAAHLAPTAAARLGAVTVPRELPFRDALRAYLYPGRRGDDGARRFAEAALAELPDRAALLADYTALEPLLYAQKVEARRADADILYMSPRWQLHYALERTAEGREVFLAATDARYDVPGLSSRFALVPAGPLHRLVPLISGTGD